MDDADAIELIRDAVTGAGGLWADLGAGDGTFTRALATLTGRAGRIYAVDRDARALNRLKGSLDAPAEVITVIADLTEPFGLPDVSASSLDGILLANTLHFIRNADEALARFVAWLRPHGRLVVVEYDRRKASRWVPYPTSPDRLNELAINAGLTVPIVTATRDSDYGGHLYVAMAERKSVGD